MMVTKRVLIIDDEADVRAVLRGCLEDIAGWEVITAPSGSEGLRLVIADPPDAILLDVMMPHMDGLTFIKLLRTHPQGTSIPVVLLTAKTSLTSANFSSDPDFKLDVKGVIPKPFDPFLLIEQFAHLLDWDVEL
ncbi:MAG: response regulator [Elainella sp. Prado103]|jgi:CheY-like chemotaxis protein|nr:response regulator [Elainella sp. Prado103]